MLKYNLSEEKRDVARKRWRRIASRRKQLGKRGNTLNANFRRNFEEMQKAMQEEETQRKEFAMDGSVSYLSLVS